MWTLVDRRLGSKLATAPFADLADGQNPGVGFLGTSAARVCSSSSTFGVVEKLFLM